jgi:D-3-phosphoglycerate dehydrogenase
MYILCSNPEETHAKAFQMLTDRGFKIVTPDEIVSGFDVQKISAAFVRASTKVTRQWLDQFPRLQFLLCASVGLDNIDREACQERGIQIFNAPAANSTAVAEHALTLILMLLKKINHHQSRLRSGGWRDLDYVNDELQGKTIGLVGCGAVGRKIAQLCHAFGVSAVLAFDPYANEESLQ